MHIALRFVATTVLAAGVTGTIAAATAAAVAEPQPAHTTDQSTASPGRGGAYCGQFCGDYHLYGNNIGAADEPVSSPLGAPSRDPLAPISVALPVVAVRG